MSERSRRTFGMCGRIGPGDGSRVDRMSEILGGVRALVDQPTATLRADAGAVRWPEAPRRAVSWSPTPLPDDMPGEAAQNAAAHDAVSVVAHDSGAVLHGGISGAVPVYAELDAAAGAGVHVCSRLDPLVRTRNRAVRADWDAWAHILATGGPLGGRTTFAGLRRLMPWSRLTVQDSGAVSLDDDGWPWLDVPVEPGASLDPVRDALVDSVGRIGRQEGVASLLSGGWDSRILAVLGSRASEVPPKAWTTSSDTGTVMEELVAAKVAGLVPLRHEIVPPRWDEFADDLDRFVSAVDFQTSFHVWLVPLARRLTGTTEAVLDGLGGGLFVGGAFPDEGSDRPLLDQRFGRLAKYLPEAEAVLHPRVIAGIRERTREGFEELAAPLVEHPFGATFTAYLTRTLPGISLAPYGLVAGVAPVATPFLDNAVVRAALAIPPERHAGGQLYPELLRPLAPELADLPTAAELTPKVRRHPRRVASAEAAARFRELLTAEPVVELLAPALRDADVETWMACLDRTRPQHLIRALATLALWLRQYDGVLDGGGVDGLLPR